MNQKVFTDEERSLLRVGETVEVYRNWVWRVMRVEDGVVRDVNGYERCAVTDVDPRSSTYGRLGCLFPGEIRGCER